MKIKKILLYNFKNFRNKTVIDFSDGITFLVGPNGFGKTTIFDAIELGLTGRISRTTKVTGENISYNKPFFQNEIGHPVVIKLWLEKINGEKLVIVRRLMNSSTDGKKAFAPLKSTNQFNLFSQEQINNSSFKSIDNIDTLQPINQSSIDSFLGIEGKCKIENIFNLFNYIQQEETTFFLKQTEQRRSDLLSFLVKTDEVEEKIGKIDKITRVIKGKLDILTEKKKKFTKRELADIPYQRLFSHREFAFDISNPFSYENIDQLPIYKNNIQNIINFKQNFSIPEYKRKIEVEHKMKEIDIDRDIEQAFYYLILAPIIRRPNYHWQWEKYIVENPILFEYVLLENYLQKYDTIVRNHERRKQLNDYRNKLSEELSDMTEKSLNYVQNDSLANDFELLKSQFIQYRTLRSQASQIDKNLSDLKQLRNNLDKQFDELRKHQHVDDNRCPFCNYPYGSFDELKLAYDNYKDYLTSISSQNSQDLQEAQVFIDSIITQIKQKISNELDELGVEVDKQILDKLQELRNQKSKYSVNIDSFKNFIRSYTTILPYELVNLSFTIYNQQYKLRLKEFDSKLEIESDIYTLLDIKKLENTEQKFEELRSEYSGLNFETFQLEPTSNHKISKSMVDSQLYKLREQLKSEVNKVYSINHNLISDPNIILINYFNKDLEHLENISIQDLELKKSYLDKQSNLVQNQQIRILSSEIRILNQTCEQLEEINNVYKAEVKQFKIDIVKQLRIPFFIYSAKMLQNYQQGLGIFLTYKKATENSENKAIIRFKSDPENDHDAMNQLSTGQLAVVSLAFTLALNTMFKLSDNLNFLMIDDPIQDMDAMNVLSFIEILRHGIIDKYQIILSTYSDQNALFMGYKFVNANFLVDIDYKNIRELQG